jgi:hypothetical protein
MGDILNQAEVDALLAVTNDNDKILEFPATTSVKEEETTIKEQLEGVAKDTMDKLHEERRKKTVWMAMSHFPYEMADEKQYDIWTMLAFLFNSLGTTKDEIDVLPEHLQKCFTEIKREDNA